VKTLVTVRALDLHKKQRLFTLAERILRCAPGCHGVLTVVCTRRSWANSAPGRAPVLFRQVADSAAAFRESDSAAAAMFLAIPPNTAACSGETPHQ
jgi:hypothetical protein